MYNFPYPPPEGEGDLDHAWGLGVHACRGLLRRNIRYGGGRGNIKGEEKNLTLKKRN